MKIPRPYQEAAIDYMAQANTYLCDDCGLGKTLMAIETVKEMDLHYERNLVICRKAARAQWREEILEQIPNANVVLTDHLKYKISEFRSWYITSYDELTPKSLLFHMGTWTWDTIILDEAHTIRNHQTQRAKNIINLAAGRKIALSATPIELHGGQLWSVLKWLDPDRFPAYWTWVNGMFEVGKGYFGGYDIGDPINQVEYQAEIMPYIIRRTKQMVDPDLPPKIEIPVTLEMEGDQLKGYNQIMDAKDVIVTLLEMNELLITNALTLFTRLHQMSVLPELLNVTANSIKMEWLDEWLHDHKQMRVVVFSKYRPVINYLREHYGCYVVMQGINESEKFKKDSGSRMIAGTIDAMSESLSFETADAEIFLDEHWSSTKMSQATERIHRMNITDKKLIYYLRASDVDRRVAKAWTTKTEERQMLLEFARSL